LVENAYVLGVSKYHHSFVKGNQGGPLQKKHKFDLWDAFTTNSYGFGRRYDH
jgi:hypothetical protein